MAGPTAVLSEDGARVTIRLDLHCETIGVADLPGRLRMYQELAARKSGKYRENYIKTVAALEAVRRDIAARGGV